MTNTTDTTYDYDELIDLANYAEGNIRQALVLNQDDEVNATSIGTIQVIANTLKLGNKPMSILFDGSYSSYNNATDLPSVRVADQYNVSVFASKDVNKSITSAAAFLGLLSTNSVSRNNGEVALNNLTKGTHYADIEFVTGEKLQDTSDAELEVLRTKGWITIRDFVGYSGAYFIDSYTTDLSTSDLAYVENVRTMDKAIRNCRVALIPSLNSPLKVEESGALTEQAIAFFEDKVSVELSAMLAEEELSGYKITIDPLQNVLTNSILNIDIELMPIGIARYIKLNVQYALNITS